MRFVEIVEVIVQALEGTGIAVIVIGTLLAAGRAVGRIIRKEPDPYDGFRRDLGRSILLGLELLVAGDICRTVALTPTLQNVGVLALIVGVRTFLSWSLEVEIEGYWPWQKASHALNQGSR